MNEQASATIFQELSQILEEQGLRWLVDAVERETQEGIIEEATKEDLASEVLLSTTLSLEPEFRRSIKKAEFLVRREFTIDERLRMLVNAIEEVVTQANDIEHDMLQFFHDTDGPGEFMFTGTESVPVPVGVSLDRIGQRSAAVKDLHVLLQELRQEIVR